LLSAELHPALAGGLDCLRVQRFLLYQPLQRLPLPPQRAAKLAQPPPPGSALVGVVGGSCLTFRRSRPR